jgi:hypothetical protein
MILPSNRVSAPRCRAFQGKHVRVQPGRQSAVQVRALFGMGGAPSGGSSEAVTELVNSKLGGPSEAGNAKVSDAVRFLPVVPDYLHRCAGRSRDI